MGHYCGICGREHANERFSGGGHAEHVCRDCARERRAEERARRKAQEAAGLQPEVLARLAKHTWQFKKHFRTNAYGWRGSSLACQRLREAVSEIKKVAKRDPLLACEGILSLLERIWPALQGIDTSSGALGGAVWSAVETLLPTLIDAPAEIAMRRMWTERLFEAIQEDGVDYLVQVQECWGRICGSPELASEWADEMLPMIREAWSRPNDIVICPATLCLSSLLEAGRYPELKGLLDLQRFAFWSYNCFWAEALRRQGKDEEALAYAESILQSSRNDFTITAYCESILLEAGRWEEAYEKYGLSVRFETTYLNQFRAIKKKYPQIDPRRILDDLINASGDKGQWFAAARQFGYLDVALECARGGVVNPQTLTRAAKDTAGSEPEFARAVSLRALELLVQGYGYDVTAADVRIAFDLLIQLARTAGNLRPAIEAVRQLAGDAAPRRSGDVRGILVGLLDQVQE